MRESKDLIDEILSAWPLDLWRTKTIVVAVSGGADSTALLDALVRIRADAMGLVVAHFNHGLRGLESDRDEEFVAQLAQARELRFVSQRRPVDPHLSRPSEGSLREDRYRFLTQVAFDSHSQHIVLGHHADDQVETFVHRLLRGAGPRGLGGMRVQDRMANGMTLVRPMLHCTRDDIIAYLTQHSILYRNDPSNASNDYTRNKIRNEWLPTLESFAGTPGLKERWLQTMMLLREQQSMIEAMAEEIWEAEQTRCDADQLTIRLTDFDRVPWPVQRQFLVEAWHRMGWPLREMSFGHWDQVRALIERSTDDRESNNQPKRLDLPGHLHLRIAKQRITVTRNGDPSSESQTGTQQFPFDGM